MSNDAILTKDNLLKRKWKGDPTCYFCDMHESIPHLFFQCHVTKTIWAVVAKCFGADTIHRNLDQCWRWVEKWSPFGKNYHAFGISARNRACFDEVCDQKSPRYFLSYLCTDEILGRLVRRIRQGTARRGNQYDAEGGERDPEASEGGSGSNKAASRRWN